MQGFSAFQRYQDCCKKGELRETKVVGHPSLLIKVVQYETEGRKKQFMLMQDADAFSSHYVLYLLACETLWQCVECTTNGCVHDSLWASLSKQSFDIGVEAWEVKLNMMNIIHAGHLILKERRISSVSVLQAWRISKNRDYLTVLCKKRDFLQKISFFHYVALCQKQGSVCLKTCFNTFQKNPVLIV